MRIDNIHHAKNEEQVAIKTTKIRLSFSTSEKTLGHRIKEELQCVHLAHRNFYPSITDAIKGISVLRLLSCFMLSDHLIYGVCLEIEVCFEFLFQ